MLLGGWRVKNKLYAQFNLTHFKFPSNEKTVCGLIVDGSDLLTTNDASGITCLYCLKICREDL